MYGQVLSLGLTLSLVVAWQCAAADRYVRASVDESGEVRIITSDGRTITIVKDVEQVGFEQVAISPDGTSVGWVELETNCCTSYPIPMRLVVLSAGERHAFSGNGLPVWNWAFMHDGRHVAYHQETVHGGLGVHYEMREVASGRLIAEYDPPVDRDGRPLSGPVVPHWVKELNARR